MLAIVVCKRSKTVVDVSSNSIGVVISIWGVVSRVVIASNEDVASITMSR